MSNSCHAESEPVLRALAQDIAAAPIIGVLLRRCAAAVEGSTAGARLYLVGGTPRDRAIETAHRVVRPRGDLDLLAVGLGEEGWAALGGSLARELAGTGIGVHPDVGRAFPVIKLSGPGLSGDLAPARSRTAGASGSGVRLEQDLARRDFTIDALAVAIDPEGDPPLGALHDPFGGLSDVAGRRLASVGTPAQCFGDDPARLYRAVRLETELAGIGFALDDALAAEARRSSEALAPTIPPERMIADVERALRADASVALARLDDLGLLAPVGLPPRGGSRGASVVHDDIAGMLGRLGDVEIPRSVLWGIVLGAGGPADRDAVRALRLPRRTAAVATRLRALRDAAGGPAPDAAWLDRQLTHRLTAPEAEAVTRLLGAGPLDPEGRLARLRDQGPAATLAVHLEDARQVERALSGGMPRRLALPPVRRRMLRWLRRDPARWVEAWRDAGLLAPLLPELEAMSGVPQPPEYHAEGDVLHHTVLALEALGGHYPDASDVLVLAVLLHDVGKPETLRMPEETGDRIRFHGHDRVGALAAEQVALDLGLDEGEAADVRWMVRHHLAFFDALGSMRPARAARVFAHHRFLDLLRLHHCDCLASLRSDGSGDLASPRRAILRYGDYLAERARERQARAGWDRLKAAGVDGWTLKERLGLTDGPAVGRCLAALRAAVEEDPALGEEEIWELARGIVTGRDRGR